MRRRWLWSPTMLLVLLLGASGAGDAAGLRPSAIPASVPLPAVDLHLPDRGITRLLLEDNELLAPGARFTLTDATGRFRTVTPEAVRTFKGLVAGDPDSVVRLTVTPGWAAGTIVTEGRRYEIEADGSVAAVTRWSAEAAGVVVAPAAEAGMDPVDTPLSGWQIGVGRNNCQVNECGTLTAKIILDADMFFRSLAPSTCFSRQLAHLNELEGIFSRPETDIRFQVTQVNCRTAADFGPKGSSLIPYHERFRDAWAEAGNDRSLVHLAVGFDFGDGEALGRAWKPGVCGRISPDPLVVGPPEQRCSHGYTMYQAVKRTGVYRATVFDKAKLGAFLFGAAFNADSLYAEACTTKTPRSGTIMCSPMQWEGPNVYSPRNAERIRAHAEKTIGYLAEVP